MTDDDRLAQQMSDVLRFTADSGWLDAHRWIVDRWGLDRGICGHQAPLMLPAPPIWCHLTHGHTGAHGDGNGAHWTEARP